MDKKNYLDIFERYLSGKATLVEVSELKSLLEKDIAFNKWLEVQISEQSDMIDSDIKMRMLNNIRSQTDYTSPKNTPIKGGHNLRFYLRRISNIAAILLPVAILFGGYLYLRSPKADLFEVTADMGEKASLTLPEGTKVALNSGSKIFYYSNYNLKNRDLILDGEAFFEVSHNPEKPFIVQCKDIKIKVLGTSFGIKAYNNEEDISVVLKTGKIQLITPKEEINMNPNDRIVYNRKMQTTYLEKVNAEDYTDWRRNRLRFENESLETIMKTISRMHNIDIIFENSQLRNQRFTGTIDNSNIESVLNAISLTSSVNYKVKEGVVSLY